MGVGFCVGRHYVNDKEKSDVTYNTRRKVDPTSGGRTFGTEVTIVGSF